MGSDETRYQASRPRHRCRQADLLRRLPVSARSDQLCGVAVLSFSAESAHGRGDAGRARHRGDVRDGAVGSHIRAPTPYHAHPTSSRTIGWPETRNHLRHNAVEPRLTTQHYQRSGIRPCLASESVYRRPRRHRSIIRSSPHLLAIPVNHKRRRPCPTWVGRLQGALTRSAPLERRNCPRLRERLPCREHRAGRPETMSSILGPCICTSSSRGLCHWTSCR